MKKLITLMALALSPWVSAQNNIVGYEYWFDEDHINRQWVEIAPQQFGDITDEIEVPGLDIGYHYLRIRFKDDGLTWSSVLWRMFSVDVTGPVDLISLRYWSDQTQDPPTNLIEVPFDDPTQYIDIFTNLDFCTYNETGATRSFYQLKDSRNQWSSVIARDINIDAVGQAPHSIIIDGPEVVQTNTEYTYTVSSVGGNSYEWTLPEGWTLLSSAANSITVLTPGETLQGTIVVMASNLCDESAEPGTLDVSFSGVSVKEERMEFRAYPNPTSGPLTLELKGTTGPAEVHLHDLHGRSVMPSFRVDGADRHVLDLSGHAQGMYMVRIVTAHDVTSIPIILQR